MLCCVELLFSCISTRWAFDHCLTNSAIVAHAMQYIVELQILTSIFFHFFLLFRSSLVLSTRIRRTMYVFLLLFFVTFLFVSLNPFGLSFVSCNEQISFKMMGKLSRPHLPLGSMWRCCNTGTLSSRSGILVDRQLFALIGDATTRILTQSFLLLTVVT